MDKQNRKLFTSESVTGGHPDKLCDQISDAVLDAIMAQDPQGRVACECCTTTGVVWIMGEISTSCYVDIPKIARQVIIDAGYDSPGMGFDGHTCAVLTAIDEQSADIALGVDKSLEQKSGAEDEAETNGAGDQGLMFGYACDETPDLMPLPIWTAHRLAERLAQVRRSGEVPGLRPDGKTQVTVEYSQNRPVRVSAVVVSTQHDPDVELSTQLAPAVRDLVVAPVLEGLDLDTSGFDLFVNPTGSFVIGGPRGDAGLTGRKIIVDTYGGSARHGGGAFSGKDPSKVDRSASYALRWVAKNVVAAGLASRCEVQVAYAIGRAHPVGLYVDTFGTGQVPDDRLAAAISDVFDLRPAAIIADLDLLRPIYSPTAAYGHFGRADERFTWEQTSRVDALRAAVG